MAKSARVEETLSYIEQHRSRFEEEWSELLRLPSVSADPAYEKDVHAAAEWLLEKFKRIGLEAEFLPHERHPIVFAESPRIPGAPTVLVYGHYDVQPPDPLDQWITPPFEPTRRNGNMYARGATDDKGQMLTQVFSTEAWLATGQSLPINVKYLIEGEEEVGSEHLDAAVEKFRDRLACDCVVISDTCQFAPGQPAITYGLRGIAYYELQVTGPNQDLHSGSFGGAVANPAWVVMRLLADLADDQGRITIPGFYDDVEPLRDEERAQFQNLGFDDRQFCEQLGVPDVHGEAGYTTLERRWARPSYDVNGMWGGYQGEGAKTVIPATAGAKFSFRLVPHQDPTKITVALREHLEKQCPPGVRLELREWHGAPGFVLPLDSPYMSAAKRAIAHGFDKEPVLIREGGSIPVVTTLCETLGADALLLGWGLHDDNPHSPNEKFSLHDFYRGIRTSAVLWREMASGNSA